jgi:DNA primase
MGACPFCGGEDRFRVWPNHPTGKGRFWCRVCGEHGDAIDYIQRRDGVSFYAACRTLNVDHRGDAAAPASASSARAVPQGPSELWRHRAETFAQEASAALWASTGDAALERLRQRGFSDDTIRAAELGLQPCAGCEPPNAWGLPDEDPTVYIPAGIVIPWRDAEGITQVQVRCLAGDIRYMAITGSCGTLYGLAAMRRDKPVVLTEGVFDALTVGQEAGDLCDAVATGSAGKTPRAEWVARLAATPAVLVAFDADGAGDNGAAPWVDALPNAMRWRPYWGDINEIALAGVDIHDWVARGLNHACSR